MRLSHSTVELLADHGDQAARSLTDAPSGYKWWYSTTGTIVALEGPPVGRPSRIKTKVTGTLLVISRCKAATIQDRI